MRISYPSTRPSATGLRPRPSPIPEPFPGGPAQPPLERDRDSLLATLRHLRFGSGRYCPHCGHRRVHRWGNFDGRQRYRCLGCRRTFSDLTRTPLAHFKHLEERLPAYLTCFLAAQSVRRTAAYVGCHPATAFRWRHRLLDGLRTHDTDTLAGWVELDAFWLPPSHKGQRHLPRPPRPRGRRPLDPFRSGQPRVHVLVAADRLGHLLALQDPRPAPAAWPGAVATLQTLLTPRLRLHHPPPLHLTAAQGPFGSFARFARQLQVPYHVAKPEIPSARLPPSTTLAHLRTVRPYIRRFRTWLAPFRGVATRYLSNYLVWHRRLDAPQRTPLPLQLLHHALRP